MAHALDRDLDPVERMLAQGELHARLDAAPDPEGGVGRGIARAAMRGIDAGDVAGHAADHLHVLDRGAAVLGGDVVAAQVVDELTERAEQRGAIEAALGLDQHRLAAAVVEAGQGGLVGHAAGQPQRVDERVALAVVVDEAAAAQRGAQTGVVDRDDGLKSAGLVALEVDLAIAVLGQQIEDSHGRLITRAGRTRHARARGASGAGLLGRVGRRATAARRGSAPAGPG